MCIWLSHDIFLKNVFALHCVVRVTLWKLERCFKQPLALNTSARNSQIGLNSILLVSRAAVMVDKDSRGHSYLTVKSEILGFVKSGLLRKHLPSMFSLIKLESYGIEDDQIPS